MDQLKEALRQAIKHRFWIALFLAALLPAIGFFVGVGPVRKAEADEAGKITAADKDVSQYAGGSVVNGQYRPIVSEKTEVLSTDVQKTWEKLYARQAPLLKWPERVEDKFPKWGRQWPEGVDPGQIQIAIIDYVNAYDNEVTSAYTLANAFDPIEGTGVVSAPPQAQLLRPATFTIETPPSLGKVWAAQERLWIQGTMLDVVAKVNASATKWDDAIIKQVNVLEVGNPLSQDQRSIAKGDTLEKAADIDDPSKPAEEAAVADDGYGGMPGGGRAEMMGGMGMMMGGMGGATNAEDVYYIANESTQYKVMPVKMTVLIEQDRIQDFLVALENSPMNIQVMDFEMTKPEAPVVKPEKGVGMNFGMGMGMMGMMGGMPGMDGMTGYGGAMARGMGGMGMMGGMPGMMGGMPGMDGGMGMGMGGMGMAPARQGVDKRGENAASKFEKQVKAARSVTTNSLFNPYFNIVEVTIYGQARFFNPPVEAPAVDPSASEAATEEAAAE